METTVGGILNRFKVRSRRLTLFFEDIITEYIMECEQYGCNKDIRQLTEMWGELLFYKLVPVSFKKLPTPVLIKIAKKSWSNLGILDDIHVDKKGDTIYVTTRGESITNSIGKNDFMIGFFKGAASALYSSRLNVIGVIQNKELCEYQFKLTHEPITIIGKDKSLYDKLNYLEPLDGFILGDAFRKSTLQLRERNRILFREKRIIIMENTIFQLVGAVNLLLDELPKISYNFFSSVIEKESADEQKLNMLKNLLQIMGWGAVKIIVRNRGEILLEIKNPPYGLQLEKDNWHFLNRTILGYLWLLDEGFRIMDINESYKNLNVLYSY